MPPPGHGPDPCPGRESGNRPTDAGSAEALGPGGVVAVTPAKRAGLPWMGTVGSPRLVAGNATERPDSQAPVRMSPVLRSGREPGRNRRAWTGRCGESNVTIT